MTTQYGVLTAALSVAVGTILGVTAPCVNAAETAPELDHVDGSTLFFKGASPHAPLKTSLTEPKLLGLLKPDEKSADYFLLTGKPTCAHCPADRAIYLYWPTGTRKEQFVYPGKIIDPKDGHVVYESRAFFGKCLNHQSGDAYVAFQKDWVEKKKHKRKVKTVETSVYVGTPTADHLHEEIVERRPPPIAEALQRVRSKQCTEIEARNRYISSIALTRKDADDEVDDSDDEDAATQKTQIGGEVPDQTDAPSPSSAPANAKAAASPATAGAATRSAPAAKN